MTFDEQNPSGAAPARARASDPAGGAPEETHPAGMESSEPEPQHPPGIPSAPQFGPEIPEDLRVPWGGVDIAVFIILLGIASIVVTWGLAEFAVRFLGVNASALFGNTMSTAKSIVVLFSQALLDGGAILFLYLMLLGRMRGPFWQSIGWRGLRAGRGSAHATALQFLSGGAMLALVVTFAGAFLSSKENLPIEQLLKARVSMLLFAVLGVVVAPLVEETIFRGFLYPVIARWMGISAGVVITGTLFGLMHAAQLWGGWGQIALLILVGVVLTWVRARTGTVTASYFVHLGYNGLQLLGYLIYIIGGIHR
ncbi:MAG: lysostaphin resistance A-like protein [Candidatus Acidiferrales bacterium]